MGALAFYTSAVWLVLGLKNQLDSSLSPAAPWKTLNLSSECRMTTYQLPSPEPRTVCAILCMLLQTLSEKKAQEQD